MVTIAQIADWSADALTEPPIDWELLAAIAMTESSLDSQAISPKGAKGLFQFMPITVRDITNRWNYPFDPFDPKASTKAAKIYLAWLMKKFPEDIHLVLAAWNWGYGNVKKFIQGKKEMPEETQNFIEKVLKKYERMRDADET